MGSSVDGRFEVVCVSGTLEAVSIVQDLNQENDMAMYRTMRGLRSIYEINCFLNHLTAVA